MKHLKEKDFVQLKALLNAGVTVTQIRKSGLTTFSEFTLYYIKRVPTFNDYVALVREKTEKIKQNKGLKIEKETIEQKPVVQSDLQFSIQIIELLAQINKNVDRLVQLWEEQPKKRFF